MALSGRIGAVAVVPIVLIGSFAGCTPGAVSAPSPTAVASMPAATIAPSPSGGAPESASPTVPAPTIPTLAETFTSPLNAFAVRYPAGWTATPASAPWVGDASLLWGAAALDDLHGTDVRLVAASQALVAGQSGGEWLAAKTGVPPCEGGSRLPAQVAVGPAVGAVTLNGCPADGGIAPGGVIYDVVVVVGTRGYDFTVDGIVDAAYVEALLETVTFER
jgi:hypothetical protein